MVRTGVFFLTQTSTVLISVPDPCSFDTIRRIRTTGIFRQMPSGCQHSIISIFLRFFAFYLLKEHFLRSSKQCAGSGAVRFWAIQILNYWYGSGSVHQQATKWRKFWFSVFFWYFCITCYLWRLVYKGNSCCRCTGGWLIFPKCLQTVLHCNYVCLLIVNSHCIVSCTEKNVPLWCNLHHYVSKNVLGRLAVK